MVRKGKNSERRNGCARTVNQVSSRARFALEIGGILDLHERMKPDMGKGYLLHDLIQPSSTSFPPSSKSLCRRKQVFFQDAGEEAQRLHSHNRPSDGSAGLNVGAPYTGFTTGELSVGGVSQCVVVTWGSANIGLGLKGACKTSILMASAAATRSACRSALSSDDSKISTPCRSWHTYATEKREEPWWGGAVAKAMDMKGITRVEDGSWQNLANAWEWQLAATAAGDIGIETNYGTKMVQRVRTCIMLLKAWISWRRPGPKTIPVAPRTASAARGFDIVPPPSPCPPISRATRKYRPIKRAAFRAVEQSVVPRPFVVGGGGGGGGLAPIEAPSSEGPRCGVGTRPSSMASKKAAAIAYAPSNSVPSSSPRPPLPHCAAFPLMTPFAPFIPSEEGWRSKGVDRLNSERQRSGGAPLCVCPDESSRISDMRQSSPRGNASHVSDSRRILNSSSLSRWNWA
eukprot:scaffold18489_cov32-Tisochrysis_lutea.AAC.3